MKYPLVANYAGDLILLETAEAATAYVERDDVRSKHVELYDADGHLLNARLVETAHPKRLLGLFKLSGREEAVVIEEAGTSEPPNENLRNLLVAYLSHPTVRRQLDDSAQRLHGAALPMLLDELRKIQRRK